MGLFILLAIPLVIGIAGFLLPIVAKVFIHLDYVLLLIIVWLGVFGANGRIESGLLAQYEIHMVFVILGCLAALGIWFGLQQIRIFRIYIFRIIACALAALLFTSLASGGFFGQTIADGMDIIWQWTVGIVYFIIAMALRARDKSLMLQD